MESEKFMITKMQLPVEYPIITSYPAYACFLSILANYSKTDDWIFDKFINLWSHIDTNGDTPFRFGSWDYVKNCPFITFTKIKSDLLLSINNDIRHFIKSSIKNEYYVYMSYDKYYIKNTYAYNKYHSEHQMFIYGYDDEKQEYYIGEFFSGKKFDFYTISYTELEKAIDSDREINPTSFVELYKYKDIDYDFDMELLRKNLMDYLYSDFSALSYENKNLQHIESQAIKKDNITFGVSYYDKLIELLEINLKQKIDYYDVRPFHTLYDHKSLMVKRIEYLFKNKMLIEDKELLNQFKEIEDKVFELRNKFLKISISKKVKSLSEIIDSLNIVKDKEIVLFNKLLILINNTKTNE